MERLIKEEILHPLDFSDLDHCIDCIKGKFIKQIKKGAIRSSGVLELIHTDICGPFPITSVDGYDSFITFTPMITPVTDTFFLFTNDLKHSINLKSTKLK